MPVFPKSLAEYKTIAALLGGNYYQSDHTIHIGMNYTTFIDPDTLQKERLPLDISGINSRQRYYRNWTYPDAES